MPAALPRLVDKPTFRRQARALPPSSPPQSPRVITQQPAMAQPPPGYPSIQEKGAPYAYAGADGQQVGAPRPRAVPRNQN